MLDQVKWCLNDYSENFRRPGFPSLELRGMYALFPEEGIPDFVDSQWRQPFPHADAMGVYLVFGRTGTLLYIGKASMGATIGGRLGTHFAGGKECRLLSSEWTERPTYVATIAVPAIVSFEAGALEEFLIRRLKPCDNRLPATVVLEDDAAHRAAEPRAAAEAPALGPGVYTYSAPGMPMCSRCGERPAIFYCSLHQSAICLECIARHDEPGRCVYLPEFRAPQAAEAPPATPSAPRPQGTAKTGSILGVD